MYEHLQSNLVSLMLYLHRHILYIAAGVCFVVLSGCDVNFVHCRIVKSLESHLVYKFDRIENAHSTMTQKCAQMILSAQASLYRLRGFHRGWCIAQLTATPSAYNVARPITR